MELYPGVKISIGPPIEDGFYYDFEFPDGVSISEADFPAIEERMRAHIKAGEEFARQDVTITEARERFLAEHQDYKVELIDDLVPRRRRSTRLESVSLYTNGPFTDLCRGPHAPSTATVKAFKLNSLAGAYWRGDSTRTMLTRIYGTAFFSKAELTSTSSGSSCAKARDHRKLGTRARAVHVLRASLRAPPSGCRPGRRSATSWWRCRRRMGAARGYSEVKTPQIFDAELWKTSGHWDKYRENMFTLKIEEREMALKPMNCPGHCQLYSMSALLP